MFPADYADVRRKKIKKLIDKRLAQSFFLPEAKMEFLIDWIASLTLAKTVLLEKETVVIARRNDEAIYTKGKTKLIIKNWIY